MFRIFVFLSLFFCLSLVKAQSVALVSETESEMRIRFEVQDFKLEKNSSGDFLHYANKSFLLKKGVPEVGKLSTAFIIPDEAEMEVSVIAGDFTEYTNVNLLPSKGNLDRTQNPSEQPFEYGKVYSEDKFFPENLAALQSPYILRDFRAQALWAYPVQYNPVQKILRVYHSLELKISQKEKNNTSTPLSGHQVLESPNFFHRTKPLRALDKEFAQIYQRQFLNFARVASFLPISEEGEMLILSDPTFLPNLQAFVAWKKQKGIPTTLVDVSTIGTTPSAIQAYIANFYATHNLKYVLLAGDNAQIPCMTFNGNPSDNAYAYLQGSDSYPEVFIGRFSAQNVSEIQTQITRTLQYEQNTSTSNAFYAQAACIGSDQGPGDDNEYDWQHQRNIKSKLDGYGYTQVAELYDGSQGGNDASGNPNPADLAVAVNAGVGVINYTGHGANNGFVTSGFGNSDVDGLDNKNTWPFIWAVACVNGEFMNTTCFAEKWLRAESNGSPTGAVAVFMATINQSWDPPMEGQDAMNDILVESMAGVNKYSFGGISFHGCMQMNDTYGAAGYEMTDTWTVFGDPSVLIYAKTPQNLSLTHPAQLNLGSGNLTVNSPTEGALVSLTQNGEILGTGYIQGGQVQIPYTLTNPSPLSVTGTAYNHVPYLGAITVNVPNAPYLIAQPFVVEDANARADYGENLSLGLTLENVGTVLANAVSVSLSSSDPYLSFTDNTESFGNIAGTSQQAQTSAFSIQIAEVLPPFYVADIQVQIQDNAGNTWNTVQHLPLYSPQLQTQSLSFSDANGNGILDVGEAATLSISVKNAGQSAADVLGNLSSVSPHISIQNSSSNLGNIAASATGIASFAITISASAPVGASIPLIFEANVNGNYSNSKNFALTVAPSVVNFEAQSPVQVNWQNAGTANWYATNVLPYEGDSCRRSGSITHGQFSTMQFSWQGAVADSVSFWYKVSSEEDYDFLQFFVDNLKRAEWSGNISAWQRFAFPLSAGNHTLKWMYKKDNYVNDGQDAAWVDFITLPTGLITDIPQPEIKKSFLYPNPAGSEIYWEKSAPVSHFKLFDMQGKILLEGETSEGKLSVDFLPAGIYGLQVEGWAQPAKFVKN